MIAYYNEHDPFAAAWLRELMKDGLIAPGEVDERDIQDVRPDELRSFRQVHLFAGIGVWSAALRGAGWPDDRPVWTASCPCQPFSQAGEGAGFADERHLWPAVYHLATQCRPDVLLGEQVASSDGLAWIDLVSADMEAAGYAGGALDLCSAGFGAPNIRQRLYFVWMADADDARSQGRLGMFERADQRAAGAGGMAGGVAHAGCERSTGRGKLRDVGSAAGGHERARGERERLRHAADDSGAAGWLDDAASARCIAAGSKQPGQLQGDGGSGRSVLGMGCEIGRPGPANGFWGSADWIGCTDGTWRPVAPGSFPLVTGHPNRVGLLRGAGNAINKEVAQGFIEAVMAVQKAQSDRIAA